MGFLSSLFGLGSSRAQPSTQTVVQAQKLPSEIAPFVEEVVGEAQELYKQRLGEGYVPFTGQTIAPLTPQEEAAMTGIEGLVGTSRPLQEEALGVTRGLGEKFTPETAEAYMSPYQRAVTDIEKREAERTFERDIMPRFEAQAVGAGGLSGLGTRAGVQAAELQRNQAQLLADIESKGLQRAYQDAQQLFGQQKAREAGMASEIARTGPAMLASGLQEAGALQRVGEERRGLAQSALDEAYFRFLEEQQFPEQTLAGYSGFVYGNPMSQMPTQTQKTTATPFQPSLGQTLLGGGLQLGGAFLGSRGGSNYFASMLPGYKAPTRTGTKHGGYISREGGGYIDRDRGLSGLPMFRRQVGGGVWEGVEDVEIETVPEETPEENPRTAIFKQLAKDAGPFPAQQTPDELTAAAETKKARRAAVYEQMADLMGKGQLTLGKTMMAIGSGISKGGGIKIGEALEKMTQDLMIERKDLTKIQAQQLLSNLEIDELTDEQIRLLPKNIAAWISAQKKAKEASEYKQAQIAKLKKEAKTAGRSTRAPTKIDDNIRKQVDSLIDTIADESFIGKKDPHMVGGKKLDRNKIGEILKGLNMKAIRGIATEAFELERTGKVEDLKTGVMTVLKERINSGNLPTKTSIIEDVTGYFD